jgi:hypothetical protein
VSAAGSQNEGLSLKKFGVVAAVAALAVSVAASASGGQNALSSSTLAASTATMVVNNESKPCNNWGRYYVTHVGANASGIRRSLLQFDLSSLPAGARIQSARLSVYETITLRGSGVVGVHRVTTPSAEGVGQNTCVGSGATWTQTGLGAAWSQAGGDFTSPDQASVSKHAGDLPGWDTFDVTPLAQEWFTGAFANDGVVLRLDDESASPCTTVTNCNHWAYASNDYSDASLRPRLTITYTR